MKRIVRDLTDLWKGLAPLALPVFVGCCIAWAFVPWPWVLPFAIGAIVLGPLPVMATALVLGAAALYFGFKAVWGLF